MMNQKILYGKESFELLPCDEDDYLRFLNETEGEEYEKTKDSTEKE